MIKKMSEVKTPDRNTRAAMIDDAVRMTLDEFNDKYPDFSMNRRQFEHFVMSIKRGDRL